MRTSLAVSLAVLGTLAAAPAALADTLLAAAPGARNLAQSGDYAVWAQPDGSRWRLAVRGPDGTVTLPDIPSFGAAPDPAVAATRENNVPTLVPYAVYARCAGTSTTAGCDVWRLDLRTAPRPGWAPRPRRPLRRRRRAPRATG